MDQRIGGEAGELVFLPPAGERPRRREELLDLAEEQLGISRAEADEIYDMAEDERLEPSVAFELVRSGYAVDDLEVPNAAPVVETGEPDWVDVPPSAEPGRERRLRASFRRVRGRIEAGASPAEALQAFMREPDVRRSGY